MTPKFFCRYFNYLLFYVLLCLVCAGSASAQASIQSRNASIINSTLAEIKLYVVAGGVARITNSHICTGHRADMCIIAVEKGGRLQIANSKLGVNLKIYGPSDDSSWLEVTNTEMPGTIQIGLPEDSSGVVAKKNYDDKKEHILKQISNVKVDNYTLTLAEREAVFFSNADICQSTNTQPCFINLGIGTELGCSNSIFGTNLSLNHQEPYLTSIMLNNCTFYGPWIYSAKKAASAPQIREEDEKLASELKRSGVAARATESGVVINLPDIFFEFDKSDLTSEALENLRKASSILSAYNQYYLSIIGHTDSFGGDEYNDRLSIKRALSVKEQLIHCGVNTSSITDVIGYGKKYPIATNETEAGRAQNRRVEIHAHQTPANLPQSRRASAGISKTRE